MGNYVSTKAEIKDYICARTPLVVVDSPERERVERMLREIASELNIDISYYTDSKQVCSLKGEGTKDVDSDPLQFIASTFKKHRNSTFAFGDIKRIGEDNVYSREVLNILYLAKETNCTLVLITADTVWSRLAQFGMLTTLDYPDMEERTSQIEDFISRFKGRYTIEWDSDDIHMAATLLRGFSEIQIENILSTELVSKHRLSKEHIYELTSQKSRLYSAVSSIQMIQVDRDLKVSGLEVLKSWLNEKKRIFFASDDALKERDLTTPKGILLAGVPGCGKSLSAKMVAKEWELPLFRFDIGTVYDKWVGESEKKMKEALQFIDNVSLVLYGLMKLKKLFLYPIQEMIPVKECLDSSCSGFRNQKAEYFLLQLQMIFHCCHLSCSEKGDFLKYSLLICRMLQSVKLLSLNTQRNHFMWTYPRLTWKNWYQFPKDFPIRILSMQLRTSHN